MQVKKVVVSSIIGVGMGAAAFAGATGTASASPSDGGGWTPGSGLVKFSANVKVASGNFNDALSYNKVLSGNFNGNTFNIASGNTIKLGVLNNAIFNSGANSFNTTTIKNINSYNTVTSPASKYKPGGNFSH